jgi:ubiquinone/menaquinone biosynthesis C-methylase UbiE
MELPVIGGRHVEQVVQERYSAASRQVEPALCCPVQYDSRFLQVLPAEILERDYGCGDPSRYVRPGETVLDLGSGGGKICYIASQIVGKEGRVIGVDKNEDMLELARKYQQQVGERIGWHNVEFRRGRIQDLATDLDDPARRPMIADLSIDVVLSNCVLNLVAEADRRHLFAEVFRVLKPGGRAAISDIVSDRPVPEHLKSDATLWSGCISGAYEESAFLSAFAAAGFVTVELVARQAEPWTVVEGIEFRSVTVRAYKPLADGTVPLSGCCEPDCCY